MLQEVGFSIIQRLEELLRYISRLATERNKMNIKFTCLHCSHTTQLASRTEGMIADLSQEQLAEAPEQATARYKQIEERQK